MTKQLDPMSNPQQTSSAAISSFTTSTEATSMESIPKITYTSDDSDSDDSDSDDSNNESSKLLKSKWQECFPHANVCKLPYKKTRFIVPFKTTTVIKYLSLHPNHWFYDLKDYQYSDALFEIFNTDTRLFLKTPCQLWIKGFIYGRQLWRNRELFLKLYVNHQPDGLKQLTLDIQAVRTTLKGDLKKRCTTLIAYVKALYHQHNGPTIASVTRMLSPDQVWTRIHEGVHKTKCLGCNEKVIRRDGKHDGYWQCAHILAGSQGWPAADWNLLPLCASCNNTSANHQLIRILEADQTKGTTNNFMLAVRTLVHTNRKRLAVNDKTLYQAFIRLWGNHSDAIRHDTLLRNLLSERIQSEPIKKLHSLSSSSLSSSSSSSSSSASVDDEKLSRDDDEKSSQDDVDSSHDEKSSQDDDDEKSSHDDTDSSHNDKLTNKQTKTTKRKVLQDDSNPRKKRNVDQ